MAGINNWLERRGMYVALLAAWVAMLGSLYFSEIAGYIPCTLCWYQRILMYPLAGIIAIGLLRRDEGLPFYVLPFSVLGIGIATYHYLLQKTNLFSEAVTCKVGVPCTSIWINWFGFVTIPFLALTAFIIITVVTVIVLQAEPALDDEADEADEALVPWTPVGTIIGSVVIIFALLGLVGRGDEPAIDVTSPTVDTALQGVATIDGALLYQQACAACHGFQLEGIEGLGNQLAPSDFVNEQDDDQLLAFIRAGRGLDDPLNTSGLVMPESGGRPDLSDAELLAVVAHIRAAADESE